MKSLAALAALVLAVVVGALPAAARDAYVIDNAHLLSPATISQINQKVADFNAQTHKEVVVDTEPTIEVLQATAEKIMAQQQVNGVLIFVAKTPKTIGVVPDRAAKQFFPSGTTGAIRQAIASAFNSGNYDAGIVNGVDLTLSQYRSHMGALTRTHANAPVAAPARSETSGGFSMSWIWWLIVLAVIFFIIRGIFRAMAGPRMSPPGVGGPPGMGGGPGYGPGYGPGGGGMGGGMGGGGFWAGMLGGLGGAFLGNQLFGQHNEIGGGSTQAGMGDAGYQQQDASGFQSDAGQSDMGNSSFGGWGDSGGGDSGGGWGGGDSGGGGDGGW